MTLIGTSHFVDLRAARKYYRGYNLNLGFHDVRKLVANKLTNGEIHIGQPECKANETLSLNDEGRYIIKVEGPYDG